MEKFGLGWLFRIVLSTENVKQEHVIITYVENENENVERQWEKRKEFYREKEHCIETECLPFSESRHLRQPATVLPMKQTTDSNSNSVEHEYTRHGFSIILNHWNRCGYEFLFISNQLFRYAHFVLVSVYEMRAEIRAHVQFYHFRLPFLLIFFSFKIYSDHHFVRTCNCIMRPDLYFERIRKINLRKLYEPTFNINSMNKYYILQIWTQSEIHSIILCLWSLLCV